jgi:hypothetical protein
MIQYNPTDRIAYLEKRLGENRVALEKKHENNFAKYSRYLGNGVYEWRGINATDTRELFLMGVLRIENISFNAI